MYDQFLYVELVIKFCCVIIICIIHKHIFGLLLHNCSSIEQLKKIVLLEVSAFFFSLWFSGVTSVLSTGNNSFIIMVYQFIGFLI